MTKTSIMDKLSIILEVSKSSKIFIAILVFIILLTILALTMNKKNEKGTKTIYMLVYAFIIIAILVGYSSSISKMFDYMMNNFFIALYFPNLAIYFAALIVANIIFLVSVFNPKITKIIKNINVIFFATINYLLALILNIIHTEKLDVFTQTSVYSNQQAQALIELSSTIFMVWIAFLIVYKIIRMYQEPSLQSQSIARRVVIEKKVKVLPNNIKEVRALDTAKIGTKEIIVEKRQRVLPINIKEVVSPRYVKQLPQKENIVTKRERILPENIKEIRSPRYVKQLPRQVVEIKPQVAATKTVVKPKLNQAMSAQEIDMLLAPAYDKMFSLDDYKKMRNILVEKQQKQQEQYQDKKQEQLKFQQLKDLYESLI